jgi:hypothetical protein
MRKEKWMQRYVYTELYDIFFGEFPIILIEWLEILVDNTGRYRIATLRKSTPELVRELKSVSNKTSRAINLWLRNILGEYITEIAVDCTQSYSVVERDFFKGPHERLMKALGTWINMLLCDKCVMMMDSDC